MIHEKYAATVAFLFEQLPMYQRDGARAFRKDLTNTLALAKALGNPQERYPTIHIAGTNGKGSTAHMLAAVLRAAGLRVGLYVSPHYRDFRERIRVNGQLVSKEFVVDFTEQCKPLLAIVQPSFFEISVAMAFAYFAERAVDIAVIEVGMGGRLDSTNIIHPELSVITNISFDHMQFLGDTLPAIAAEKAGIIKPGVPVVIGETHRETAGVFQQTAQASESPIYFADQHFKALISGTSLTHTTFQVTRDGQPYLDNLELEALGTYQQRNVQTALQALALMADRWPITEAAIREGFAHLRRLSRFMGRWQVLGHDPLVIADSAHNEGGLLLAMEQLKTIPREQLHLVIGTVNDKEVGKMLALLPPDGHYYFARPAIPRGLDAEELARQAADLGLQGRTYKSVPLALRAAKRQAKAADVIYIGGSTFVVAETVRFSTRLG